MREEDLLFSVKDNVATVTINREAKLNAFDSVLVQNLYNLMCRIDEDPEIRVVVIKGSGSKAFVAGADVGEMAAMDDGVTFRDYFDKNVRMFQKIRTLKQPVIAAVNGYAFGGGSALAMACDLIVATEKSKFGVQETNMGIIGNGSALTKLVGKHKAAELTMLGAIIDAQEAYRLLLVNKVVKEEALDETVDEICKKLCQKSKEALHLTKVSINQALDTGLSIANNYETDLATICFETKDCKDAMNRFLNKK